MKNFIFFLLVFLSTPSLFAQADEIGIMAGVMRYTGDLNPSFINTLPHFFHPAGGLLYRHNWNKHYSFKGNLVVGMVSAADSLSKDSYQENRNLSFRSLIIEGSTEIEFNFLPFVLGSEDYIYSPYIFAGLSVFYFNPQAEYEGEWVNLEPLHLGGISYSLLSFAIPFGMGMKWNLGKYELGIEVGTRKTYTDNMDDAAGIYQGYRTVLKTQGAMAAYLSDPSLQSPHASAGMQRGDTGHNNWYMFSGITLSIPIGGNLNRTCENNFRRF